MKETQKANTFRKKRLWTTCRFVLFYSLLNCILVLAYFRLFLFSFCKLPVKNWQIVLIYPSIFLIFHSLWALCLQSGGSLFGLRPFWGPENVALSTMFYFTVGQCHWHSDISPGFVFSLTHWLTNSQADPTALHVTLNSGSLGKKKKKKKIALLATERMLV